MNGNDISRLSYKELQALALRYRVPGNIKKKLLVRILQAARGGDDGEVGRLLQDLRQTRKKRVRKSKTGKLGITSTPIHSPNYVMADDYYCPPQQQPCQWVGAEEEISNRDDDNRIPHYEEFRQFLLRKIQREFQSCDTNNNQVQEANIVDLRTASSSTAHSLLDESRCLKTNFITVNEANAYAYPQVDRVEYQIVEDSNGNSHGPILLKKMLQAPVGADLGEIASPMLGGRYRILSVEQYQSNNFLDNSDTLTAESESNGNEENLDGNTECYGILHNVNGEYFFNEPNFVKNVEEIGQQISNVLNADDPNQQRYTYADVDTNQNYETWTVANLKTTDTNCMVSDVNALKVLSTMYYDNTAPNVKALNDGNSTSHYQSSENMVSYDINQNVLNLNSIDDTQYYSTNMVSNLHLDSNNSYYLQNIVKQPDPVGDYVHPVQTTTNSVMPQDSYISGNHQTFSNDANHNTDLSYQYSYLNNHNVPSNSIAVSGNIQPQQNNNILTQDTNIQKDFATEQTSISGVLDPFWPKWASHCSSTGNLENILNLSTSVTMSIDYTKIDQTSCVYCYTAPIVTQQPVSSTSSCSQKKKFIAEHRQHSFMPYWLLYNDTSTGMRMANLRYDAEANKEHSSKIMQVPSTSNSDIKDSAENSEDSINDVWINDCSNYQCAVQKDGVNACDNNEELTDSLFAGKMAKSHVP